MARPFLTTVFLGAALFLASTPVTAKSSTKSIDIRSFATKTAYWDQRRDNDDDDDDDDDDLKEWFQNAAEEVEDKKLKLVQVQQVNRHGTRFPTSSNTKEMIALMDNLKANYSSYLPKWLQNYTLPYSVDVDGELAPAGATELVEFGTRTRQTVGSSLPTNYTADRFIFQHTYKSRTKNSAIAFASTFFTNPSDVQYIQHPKSGDRLLRYFDECDRYNQEVADNDTSNPQLDAYKASSTMETNIAFIKSKLNLPSSAELSVTDVESVFTLCAFDIAIYDTKTNWCSLVNQDFLDSMDYEEDLESFYEQGAGYKINYEIASVLLKDIYQYMADYIAGNTTVVGNFRFAHAETTLPLMTLLGYGSRTPLLASFSAKEIAKRGFRTSRLAPLGANIDFRLYQSKKDKEKYYVQVLVNEKVAELPGCDEVFCKFSKVKKLWDYYLNTYNFDEACKV